MTGIPVAKLMQGERDKLLQMESRLHERVVGQSEAIDAVSNAIRRSRRGFIGPKPSHRFFPVPRPNRGGVKPNFVRPWLDSCLTAKSTWYAWT